MAVATVMRTYIRNLGSTLGLAVARAVINNSSRKGLSAKSLGSSTDEIRALV